MLLITKRPIVEAHKLNKNEKEAIGDRWINK